ncbi:hypothetical protein VTO42DRAFT_6397 [Malbranchea cinnamomea]
MSSETSSLAKLDAALADLLAGWNVYSTALATLIVAYAGYSVFFSDDPDAHPYLLARQAIEAPIRQPGESATFRASDVPHGYPLKSGLNVKDPGTPKWSAGRDGDLRDIWRAAVRGELKEDGTPSGNRGKIYSVLGDNVVEHNLDDISREINVLGQYIRDSKAQTAAICLSDSVEFLVSIFAGAFYGFKTVIIPHNLPSEVLAPYLHDAGADVLIAEAGAVDISLMCKAQAKLRNVIWVSRGGAQHVDWSQHPKVIDSNVSVADWHQLIESKNDSVGSELPSSDPSVPVCPLTTLWSTTPGKGTFVEYTQGNLVAGVAGLGASLPRAERLTSSDLLLPIDSLARSYTLCLTLAALYVNASIALTSVAGEHVDLSLATKGISPTVIVASSHTIADYHAQHMATHMGLFSKLGRFFQSRALDNGVMPKPTRISRLLMSSPVADPSLNRLRLLCISHRADGSPENQLTSEQLTDLRIFLGARVIYALTSPNVAGAVSQTNAYDYRRHSGPSHFGPPLSSLEIKLTGHQEGSGPARKGEIVCSGPSVVSGKFPLGIQGRFRDDNTLTLSV